MLADSAAFDVRDSSPSSDSDAAEHTRGAWLFAAGVALAYYAGARFGLALTFAPLPTSILWPPNALLLGALLLRPAADWPRILLAVLPVHVVAELAAGIPIGMVLSWYLSNCSEALLGAGLVLWAAGGPVRLDRLRDVVAFFACGSLASPFLSSFLDASLVVLNQWGDAGFYELFEARFFSNCLASAILVPVIVTWRHRWRTALRRLAARRAETVLFFLGLALLGVLVFLFDILAPSSSFPVVLYLPVPVLIWAALRFGPAIEASAFAIVSLLVIWGYGYGHGPFQIGSPGENLRAIQLYLIFLQPPLLALAALLEERRGTERRLRSSEERFATAFRSSPDAMSISRQRDGRLMDVNARWETLFGWSRVEALDRPLLELLRLPPEDRELLARRLQERLVGEVELRALDRNGELLSLLVALAWVELDGQTCLLATVRDITAQRRAEREASLQRRQATHLARVNLLGELSGALAHELNQPLTAILNNAEAAQRFLAQPDVDHAELRDALAEIVDADQRASTVIQRLRALLRNDEPQHAPIGLNSVLSEVLELAYGELVTRRVQIAARLDPALPRIEGDRVQLQQLYLNLVTNACDAMAEVEAERRTLSLSSGAGPRGTVRVSISDGGPGLPPERLPRVFEPFVTTKPNGLGLGLAICRTIVLAHGGRIWAENRPPGGATFHTEFPALG